MVMFSTWACLGWGWKQDPGILGRRARQAGPHEQGAGRFRKSLLSVSRWAGAFGPCRGSWGGDVEGPALQASLAKERRTAQESLLCKFAHLRSKRGEKCSF